MRGSVIDGRRAFVTMLQAKADTCVYHRALYYTHHYLCCTYLLSGRLDMLYGRALYPSDSLVIRSLGYFLTCEIVCTQL